MTEQYHTHRWRGVVAASVVAAGVGILGARPDVLLLAGVGVVFATYPWVFSLPEPDLAVERRLDTSTPAAGQAVTVTVTVTNRGDDTLWDLRLVDGVPPALSVVDGSPRCGATLRPGATTTFTYDVETIEGHHQFDPLTVVARDLSGGRELETAVGVETQIRCELAVDEPPVRNELLQFVGRLVGDRGGPGLEFHTLREYRTGDPINRIAWSQYARHGVPATVDYRVEQTATVVVLVDAREPAYRSRPDEPHAVHLSVSAAEQLMAAFAREQNPVGLAGIGRDVCYLSPGTGRHHQHAARRRLLTDATFSSAPAATEPPIDEQFSRLASLLPSSAQVVLLSPMIDDDAVTFVEKLDSLGWPVTVVSPDVTDVTSPGQRLAAVERRNRVDRCRCRGIPVVNWPTELSLPIALYRATLAGGAA